MKTLHRLIALLLIPAIVQQPAAAYLESRISNRNNLFEMQGPICNSHPSLFSSQALAPIAAAIRLPGSPAARRARQVLLAGAIFALGFARPAWGQAPSSSGRSDSHWLLTADIIYLIVYTGVRVVHWYLDRGTDLAFAPVEPAELPALDSTRPVDAYRLRLARTYIYEKTTFVFADDILTDLLRLKDVNGQTLRQLLDYFGAGLPTLRAREDAKLAQAVKMLQEQRVRLKTKTVGAMKQPDPRLIHKPKNAVQITIVQESRNKPAQDRIEHVKAWAVKASKRNQRKIKVSVIPAKDYKGGPDLEESDLVPGRKNHAHIVWSTNPNGGATPLPATEEAFRAHLQNMDTISDRIAGAIEAIVPADDPIRDHLRSGRYTPRELLYILSWALLDNNLSRREVERWTRFMDDRILPYLRALGDPLAVVLPQGDDWLGFSLMGFDARDDRFERRIQALARVSPRGAALLLGADGPHLREDFTTVDQGDLEGYRSLLRSTLQEFKRLTAGTVLPPHDRAEARMYMGAIVNALILPAPGFQHRVAQWDRLFESEGLSMGDLLQRGRSLFPELFQKLKTYARSEAALYGHQEIAPLLKFNRFRQKAVTLRDVYTIAEAGHDYVAGRDVLHDPSLSTMIAFVRTLGADGHQIRAENLTPAVMPLYWTAHAFSAVTGWPMKTFRNIGLVTLEGSLVAVSTWVLLHGIAADGHAVYFTGGGMILGGLTSWLWRHWMPAIVSPANEGFGRRDVLMILGGGAAAYATLWFWMWLYPALPPLGLLHDPKAWFVAAAGLSAVVFGMAAGKGGSRQKPATPLLTDQDYRIIENALEYLRHPEKPRPTSDAFAAAAAISIWSLPHRRKANPLVDDAIRAMKNPNSTPADLASLVKRYKQSRDATEAQRAAPKSAGPPATRRRGLLLLIAGALALLLSPNARAGNALIPARAAISARQTAVLAAA